MATRQETEEDFKELKKRCKLIFDADPDQYHTDFSLRRYLRAFGGVNEAFQAILKTNKWRNEFGVTGLTADNPVIKAHLEKNIAIIIKHRDMYGRPVVYIAAKNHNVNERDIDELTKFIVYVLEESCKKCHEEIIDNLCIVFDLKDFGLSSMDYQFVKNLIWLLSRHYPERLGVCVIMNSPTLFTGCWSVIQGWLNEHTASKVKFASNEGDLSSYFHPDILPENA